MRKNLNSNQTPSCSAVPRLYCGTLTFEKPIVLNQDHVVYLDLNVIKLLNY